MLQKRCILEHLPELQKGCLTAVQKGIYIMMRVHHANSHRPGPGPREPEFEFVLPDTDAFFPGMLDEEEANWANGDDSWRDGTLPHGAFPQMVFHAAFCGSMVGAIAVAALLLLAKALRKLRRRGCAPGPAVAREYGAADTTPEGLASYKAFA